MKITTIFFFLSFCYQGESSDLLLADQIINSDKSARKTLDRGLAELDKGITQENLTEMIYLVAIMDSCIRESLKLKEEASVLSKNIRTDAEKKYKDREIGREEYFTRLAKASDLEKISKMSFKYASAKLKEAVKKIESVFEKIDKRKWMTARAFLLNFNSNLGHILLVIKGLTYL